MDDSQQNSIPSKKTSSSEEFDSQFKTIPNLTWKPWVGKNYTNCKNNRLLIVGESYYRWTEQGKSKDDIDEIFKHVGWTRTVIHTQGLYGKKDDGFIFGRNIERLLYNSPSITKENRQRLWHSVSFYNFIQRPLNSRKERPNEKDWQVAWEAFFHLAATLQPNYVLFCGMEALNQTSYFEEALKKNGFQCDKGIRKKVEESPIGRTYPKTKGVISDKENHQITIASIGHPSNYFSWNQWNNVIQEQMPDYLTWLKQ